MDDGVIFFFGIITGIVSVVVILWIFALCAKKDQIEQQLLPSKSGIVEWYKQQEIDKEIRHLERENILLERQKYMALFEHMRR